MRAAVLETGRPAKIAFKHHVKWQVSVICTSCKFPDLLPHLWCEIFWVPAQGEGTSLVLACETEVNELDLSGSSRQEHNEWKVSR